MSGRCGWLMHEGGHYSLTGDTLILARKKNKRNSVKDVQLARHRTPNLGVSGIWSLSPFISSFSGNIKIDRALQIVLYGVGCGMSGSWWRNQHNKHHAMPQKIGHDVDLNTLPLVAFTEKVNKHDERRPYLTLRRKSVCSTSKSHWMSAKKMLTDIYNFRSKH